ncbi:exosome complex component RRP43 [Frankliniella occidentalis]|uniref:Ribosomal RNA-processing protein 43 n=1 Tax=Frankliniella occidentalis TaxID=133901 RepID=A0A6J1SSB6_FRAOC|nr:exosome complex component RRP43 [Frankliniella occidentalis]
MAAQYKTIHPVKYYRDFLAHDLRPDGRSPDKTRNVTVNVNSISTADGSSTVRIGNTTVICGIKAELGKPKPDEPECGFMVPNVELPPLCSPLFRPGPPSEEAQAMTCFVSQATSDMVDLKELCVSTDNLAWVLHIDMICLDYDGCVQDACLIALSAALRTVKLPKVEYDAETKLPSVSLDERADLHVKSSPVSTSFAVFDDEIILSDPTGEEENLSSAKLSVVTDGEVILSVHKPGGSALSETQLQDCISVAKDRANLVNELINVALSSVDR